MKMAKAIKSTLALTAVILLAAMLLPGNAGAVSFTYQYNLSNFEGTINTLWANIAVDQGTREVIMLDSKSMNIRIFNRHGMEVHRFGGHGVFQGVRDVAVDENGNILVLTRIWSKTSLVICDFRGEPVAELDMVTLPGEFSGMKPDRLDYRKGKVYMVDTGAMKVAVTDMEGRFLKGYDVKGLMAPYVEKRRSKRNNNGIEAEITGFSVDRDGNMLFTVATMFSAFRLSPGGDLEVFGSPGSSYGKFGVAAGIASDDRGNIYVSDRLRCVVIVFDRDFNFVTEFGYRGYGPGNLIVPDDLEVDGSGMVYVSQAAGRGVSVFSIRY